MRTSSSVSRADPESATAAAVIARLDAAVNEAIDVAAAAEDEDVLNHLLAEKLAIKRALDGLTGKPLLAAAQRAYNVMLGR